MTTIFMLCAGILLVVALKKIPPTSQISVLRDITDKHLAQPKADEILSLFSLSGDAKWNGAVFRFSNLSDISYNPSSEVSVDAQSQWLSNELARDKAIQKFRDSVSAVLASAQNDSVGKEHSSIYLPVANELNRLSQSTAQKRILLVYSDLMDNDVDVSLYAKDQFRLLELHPDSLRQTFEQRMPLQRLNGIEVYFIYQPIDAEQDKEFRIVSGFYKSLLESKGATVHIGANLSN